jgi:hypothetical protein
MKKVNVMFLLSLAPAVLAGQQASTTTSGSASGDLSAKAGRTSVNGSAQASASSTSSVDVPSSYSAESRAKIEGTFSAARERNLPEQPIRDRIAEGRAKGASESQVVLAAQRTEARLEATQSAMIRAGRREPSQEEVARGEQAMVRGASEAQIELVARRTPPRRSLVVAFDVLAQLQARGVAADQAVAQIVARLDANASDRALGELALSSNVSGNGSAVAQPGSVSGAASGSVNATAAGAVGAASATAGATAGVGGLIRRPPTS